MDAPRPADAARPPATVLARRGVFALVFVASLGILFAPASAVPSSPPGTDKLVHLLTFAALGYTAVLAGLPLLATAIAVPAYAGLSELIQQLPALGRDADLGDLGVDLLGTALGLIAAVVLARRVRAWWAPELARPAEPPG